MPTLSAEQIAALGWDKNASPAMIGREMQQSQSSGEQVRRRQLGYVGYLTFNEQYQAEKARLYARWVTLPVRPWFPFLSNIDKQDSVLVQACAFLRICDLSEDVRSFLADLGQFQRTWQLAQMMTWELPLPQGPLTDVPLGLALRLLGPDQIVSTSPAYYDPPSSADERKAKRRQQKQAAAVTASHQG
jgi:hypothetical protein